jgi:putative Mn2+ efflux pump MntP
MNMLDSAISGIRIAVAFRGLFEPISVISFIVLTILILGCIFLPKDITMKYFQPEDKTLKNFIKLFLITIAALISAISLGLGAAFLLPRLSEIGK